MKVLKSKIILPKEFKKSLKIINERFHKNLENLFKL